MASFKNWLKLVSESNFGHLRVEILSWTVDLRARLAVLGEFWISYVRLRRRFEVCLAWIWIEIWLWGVLFHGVLSRVCDVYNRFFKNSFLGWFLKLRLCKLGSRTCRIRNLNVCSWRLCSFITFNWLWLCWWGLYVCCRTLIRNWFFEIIRFFFWRDYGRLRLWLGNFRNLH